MLQNLVNAILHLEKNKKKKKERKKEVARCNHWYHADEFGEKKKTFFRVSDYIGLFSLSLSILLHYIGRPKL